MDGKQSSAKKSELARKKKKALHDIMRPINLLAIERRLPTRLLLVLHTAKIRPPCLDLSACNSGRIRKRRSVANMLVQPMLLVCSTILHSFNCRSEENSSCTFVDSGTRSFFSITPKAGSVQWEHVPRVYISIGPGGKKEKEDVILYFGASVRVQRKYKSAVGGEKTWGVFLYRYVFRVASSSEDRCFFCFYIFQKG